MDSVSVRWYLELAGGTVSFCVWPIIFNYGYVALACWWAVALFHLVISLLTDFDPRGKSKLLTEKQHQVVDLALGVFCLVSPHILTGSDGYGSNGLSSTVIGFAVMIGLLILNRLEKVPKPDGTGKEE
mmetsp:Transcript_152450/g.488948  ORF Transcript_152450/g.488948 Transcript_152450/m.488948 type:complete len:128 (+) Transcript_152450:43-426(+)